MTKLSLQSTYTNNPRFYFEIEARKLLDDTLYTSSMNAITNHPSFVKIMDSGKPAISWILQRLQEGEIRTPWFPLLKRISGEDPVPPEDRGRVQKMTSTWIEWGKTKGYIW
jgi:hypothetical protein